MAHVSAPRESQKDGKVHCYWRLVRSVRVGGRVSQQTVAQLGELDERGSRALSRRIVGAPEQAALFDDGSDRRVSRAADIG
jgi:hypothetical protein